MAISWFIINNLHRLTYEVQLKRMLALLFKILKQSLYNMLY